MRTNKKTDKQTKAGKNITSLAEVIYRKYWKKYEYEQEEMKMKGV